MPSRKKGPARNATAEQVNTKTSRQPRRSTQAAATEKKVNDLITSSSKKQKPAENLLKKNQVLSGGRKLTSLSDSTDTQNEVANAPSSSMLDHKGALVQHPMAPRKTVGSREAAATVALARSSASSHCSFVCSSTVDPRRRWKTGITRGHKRLRARMGDRQQVKHDRHKWTDKETTDFIEVAVKLAENGELKKNKYRGLAFRKIHKKMVEKGSCNLHLASVKYKFYTYLDIWNRYNNLKLEEGSCFNRETGTFDAPKEWWASLTDTKKEKCMMFRKRVPHMEYLEIIFSHMEDPPKEIVWKFVSNGSSSSKSTTGHWGYERTESLTVNQGASSGVTQTMKLLNELLESGVKQLDDDYINAVNLLRDHVILESYSKLPSVQDKIAFLRKLQEQGVQVANWSHGQT